MANAWEELADNLRGGGYDDRRLPIWQRKLLQARAGRSRRREAAMRRAAASKELVDLERMAHDLLGDGGQRRVGAFRLGEVLSGCRRKADGQDDPHQEST